MTFTIPKSGTYSVNGKCDFYNAGDKIEIDDTDSNFYATNPIGFKLIDTTEKASNSLPRISPKTKQKVRR